MESIVNEIKHMRILRNNFLAQTDWTQLPDADLTASEKTAWKNYRQALRDIPAQFPDGKNIVWPTAPQ